MKKDVYFTSGCIINEHMVVLSYVDDYNDIYSPYSEIMIFDDRTPNDTNIWKVNDWIQGIIRLTSKEETFKGICTLSVNGYSEHNMYAVGAMDTDRGKLGGVFYYDNAKQLWKKIEIPETNFLAKVHPHRHEQVIIGGQEGHLLVGDMFKGFKDISKAKDLMSINSIAKSNNTIYFGTSDGLFQYQNEKVSSPDILSILQH